LIAFTQSEVSWLGFNQLLIANADGSNITPIVFDRASGNLEWTDDSKALYLTAPSNGGTPIYKLDIATKKLKN
jgi:hypothetical protein